MNAPLDISDSSVFVSKLRKTETLEGFRVRQTFDILNMPGLTVVCISGLEGEGADQELVPISQEYHLATGETFTTIEQAVLAWDGLKGELELNETLAHALLRYHHGLVRPLWEDRSPVQKEPWLTRARQFRQLATSLGISITKRAERAG